MPCTDKGKPVRKAGTQSDRSKGLTYDSGAARYFSIVNRHIEPYLGKAKFFYESVVAGCIWAQNACAAGASLELRKRGSRMRNTILVLLAGPVLFGCLTSGKPTADNGLTSVPSGNHVPTIAGNPPRAILYGDMYSFAPDAADVDGDVLTFSIDNRPSWANFDASTGRLHGQPTLGEIGVYQNVQIRVSDGTDSASLPAFSITVTESALGNVTLSWVAPTQNSDGSPLTNLAGYKVYYGKNSGRYDREIRIDNPGLTTYVVEQLSPDTYYFAATSYNSFGIESSYSGEIAKTVN